MTREQLDAYIRKTLISDFKVGKLTKDNIRNIYFYMVKKLDCKKADGLNEIEQAYVVNKGFVTKYN